MMDNESDFPYDPEPTTTPIRPYRDRTAKRQADAALDDRLRRRTIWQLIGAGILLFGLVFVAYRQQTNHNDPDPALVGAVDELRSQVRDLGGTPAVPPPEDIVDNAPEVVAIPGPEGPEGDRGPQGPAGRDGRDGSPCLPTNPFCVGPQGTPGDPGATGEAGATGPAGETIVGPEGPPGPAGVDGADGADGADGRGISSVQVTEVAPNECHLIVTYTDGTTQDAGAVDCPTPPIVELP